MKFRGWFLYWSLGDLSAHCVFVACILSYVGQVICVTEGVAEACFGQCLCFSNVVSFHSN